MHPPPSWAWGEGRGGLCRFVSGCAIRTSRATPACGVCSHPAAAGARCRRPHPQSAIAWRRGPLAAQHTARPPRLFHPIVLPWRGCPCARPPPRLAASCRRWRDPPSAPCRSLRRPQARRCRSSRSNPSPWTSQRPPLLADGPCSGRSRRSRPPRSARSSSPPAFPPSRRETPSESPGNRPPRRQHAGTQPARKSSSSPPRLLVALGCCFSASSPRTAAARGTTPQTLSPRKRCASGRMLRAGCCVHPLHTVHATPNACMLLMHTNPC